MCSPLSIQDFPLPTDAYLVAPRSRDTLMAISHWRWGTRRQVSVLNKVTQASGSPPEVTQVSLLSYTQPLGTAEQACISTEQKGQPQSHRSSPSSPPAGSENGPAIQLPLEIQGMGATRRRQPLAPKEAQHHSEHPEGIPPTTTALHGKARRCSMSAQQHHLGAVPLLISAV